MLKKTDESHTVPFRSKKKIGLCGTDRRGKSASPQLLMGTPCFWFFKFNPRGSVNRRISAALKRRKETIIIFASTETLTGLEKRILKSFLKNLI